MKSSILLLAVLTAGCFADVELAYHDGTAAWWSCSGMFRGTWFELEDFVPGYTDFLVEYVDVWFFQHSSYPWDTSDTIIELWSGNPEMIGSLLGSSQGIAYSGCATRFYYDPPVEVGSEFMCIQNTQASAGGWPSQLLDNSPGRHSFYTDDFILWDSRLNNNLMMSATGDPVTSLGRTTWGYLKTLF